MLSDALDKRELGAAIQRMSAAIRDALGDNECTIYIYGSVALDDFRFGWSDIDILCLTGRALSDATAGRLMMLRQELLRHEPDDPYYRSFEGIIARAGDFLSGGACRAVYWGTSGQRIADAHVMDVFSKKELLDSGMLICGAELRRDMDMPDYADLCEGVLRHYEAIRTYAVSVPRSFRSYGWMLDIARGIHTLRTGQIIAKTAAGRWALENGLCPTPDALRRTLLLRSEPLAYRHDKDILDYTAALGDDIQRFAGVLQDELDRASERCGRLRCALRQ